MRQPITIVDTTAAHIRELGANMRKEDALEAERLGYVPHRILFRSYRNSLLCRTGFVGDDVASVWGVCGNPLGHVGIPWLITSEKVRSTINPVDFALIYRQEMRGIAKMFPLLENWVDSTYNDSIRLLKLIGFNVDNPMPRGPYGAMFRRFWLHT